MNIKDIAAINQKWEDGVIDRYAIGDVVGATFYLEEKLAMLDALRERALAPSPDAVSVENLRLA